jgi:replicative DNA helicase
MSDEKMQPQNIEAEERVLGAMLIDDDAVIRTTEILRVDDFYKDQNRKIYHAILDCYQLEGKTDIVTVSDRLKMKGELESGLSARLAYFVSITPSSANVRRDARRVSEAALYRRVIRWSIEIKEQAHVGVEDMRDWFAKMQYGFLSLSDAIREKKSPHIADVLVDLKKQWQEFEVAKQNKDNAEMQTGKYCEIDLFKPFNSESPIPYFMPGHLIMLAGYTSAGKSTALAQLLKDSCERNAKALVFSLEEGRTTKAVKMIANLTDIPQRYLLTGELSADDFDIVQDAESKLKTWGLMVYDDVRTLDEICLKIKKHVLQGRVDIVAIDYVQNIQGSGNSIYNDMRLVGPTLLDLAVDLGITIIALSQVTNESMRDDSQIIGLKGAGELAAAADIVLWLKRLKGDDRALDCEIRKNRPFGHTGIMPLIFSDRYTQIKRRT